MNPPRRSFVSALFAFLALPGIVAFLLPWLVRPSETSFDPIAAPILAIGVALLLWCVRDFYVAGRGTLAPWAPPYAIVTIGLYRVSRNPMYLSVLTVLCGWALGYHSRWLWGYATIIAVAFHLRVLTYEEPWLDQTFHDDWLSYRAGVPRWLGIPQRT
jgi:protein-S-isoprenylcysteine O-methyltransferase Ste14